MLFSRRFTAVSVPVMSLTFYTCHVSLVEDKMSYQTVQYDVIRASNAIGKGDSMFSTRAWCLVMAA